MSNGDLGWITNFIWGIADDVLRDLYVRGKYRDVILPMTVLRRLDAVLEPTKQAVIDMKAKLDKARITNQDAHTAGLSTRTAACGAPWQVVNRLAIEELEAWFFGDWTAVQNAYPKVSGTIPRQAAYREPDAIAGGTWEALERVLRNAGYFSGGLRKVEAASAIGKHFHPVRAQSPSFTAFRDALLEAVA
jgi:hypothetical protein